jgi:hypothetical protein
MLRFDPRLVNVRLLVDQVALEQIFLQALWYSSVSIIPPMFHILPILVLQVAGQEGEAYKNNQQDALYRLICYSTSALHVSGDVFAHHQEHLTVYKVSGSIHPSCWNWTVYIVRPVTDTPHNLHSSVSTHSGHQPAATWVNTTRYCKYSQVLLMMDRNIARNMQSWLGIIN